MMKQLFLFLILIIALIVGCKTENQRPNILFILSDDHSVKAVSSYGSKLNTTPNIDRIANQGMLFENAFVVSSLCAPSRASILTSQYGGESGFLRIGDVLDTSLNTLPKILQNATYETAIFGKWHLKSKPLGFDYCQVVHDQGEYFDPVFFRSEEWNNKEKNEEASQGYFTDIITDKAINWLKNKKSDKPFALFVHHKAPHAPHITPDKYDSLFTQDLPFPSNFNDDFSDNTSFLKDGECPFSKLQNAYEYDIYNSINNKEAPSNIKRGTSEYKEWAYQTLFKGYYRQIVNLDENVGKLLDYLEQNGLDKNTIVIYTSDNGWFVGQHGLFNKMWMYEESLRIPLIISYPGHVMKNRINSSLISSLDFAPTLLDYAGVEIPSSMQGYSFKPILEGSEPNNWRKTFFYHYYDQFGVPEILGIRNKQFKLINYIGKDVSEWEFYNLKNDPEEMHNQINNPAYSKIINDLKNEMINDKNRFNSY